MRPAHEIKADFDSAVDHRHGESIRSVIPELQALGTRDALAMEAHGRGLLLQFGGDLVGSLKWYDAALEQYGALNDQRGIAIVAISIGSVHRNAGRFAEALEWYTKALAIHEDHGNVNGIISVSTNIGNVHGQIGANADALEWYERSLDLAATNQSKSGLAAATGNIGNIYLQTNELDTALEWYHKALDLYRELGDADGLAVNTGNIGNVYMEKDEPGTALIYFREAQQQYQRNGDHVGVARMACNIGLALLKVGMNEEIQATLKQLDDLDVDLPDVRITHLLIRARSMVDDGQQSDAAKLYDQALHVAHEHGLLTYEAEVHQDLRELARQRNDLVSYIEHNDTFLKINNEVKGAEVKTRLAIQAKDKEMRKERAERERERAILYSTLPRTIADRIIQGDDVSGDHFEEASVLFMDIVGFTSFSHGKPPHHIVQMLKKIFKICDDIVLKHGLTKIKTIGDSYMAAAGVPEPLTDHAYRAAATALDMVKELTDHITVRIGLHCGPLVAGIVGDERLQYDVWGDTVNVASRMESTGEPGRIQVSEAFASALRANALRANALRANALRASEEEEVRSEERGARSEESEGAGLRPPVSGLRSPLSGLRSPLPGLRPPVSGLRKRGDVEVKGKGLMTTYWLEGT